MILSKYTPANHHKMTAYFRAMRLERWPRSLAIFVGSAAFFLLNRDSLENVTILGMGHLDRELCRKRNR